jgi:hypothetical protein
MVLGEPQPEVVFHRVAVARVVAARGAHDVAPVRGARIRDRVEARQHRPDVARRARRARPQLAARWIDLPHATADHGHIRPRLEERELALEPVRRRDVVGVLHGDHRRRRVLEARVEAARDADVVRHAQHADARVTRRGGVGERGALVARAVVDDDQLEVLDGLAEDRADRLLERCGAVVRADEHGDARRHAV